MKFLYSYEEVQAYLKTVSDARMSQIFDVAMQISKDNQWMSLQSRMMAMGFWADANPVCGYHKKLAIAIEALNDVVGHPASSLEAQHKRNIRICAKALIDIECVK